MDIDADKAQAVLEQLEAEKAKRAAARVASGEVVVIRGICALGFTEEEASSCLEAMKAAEVARLRAEGEKREIVFDEDTCWAIVTGVPRADESYTPHTNTSGEAPQLPTEDAVDGTPALVASGNATGSEVPPQQPTHIRVVLRNGKDDSDDAGEIAEGVYSVERGILVLEDCDGRSHREPTAGHYRRSRSRRAEAIAGDSEGQFQPPHQLSQAGGHCVIRACTHKSPSRRVCFRANRTSSRHRRMTESDPEQTSD
jgi:hypothetical protein